MKGWWEKNQDFMLIRLFNPNDLIGCGGDINQSDSVGLCRSMWGLHGSTQGSMWVYVGDFFEGVVGKKSGFYVI